MKNFRSSLLRPFGSLVKGMFITAVILAFWLGIVALLQHGFDPVAALDHKGFQVPAALVLIIGGWATLCGFNVTRARYRAGPTELTITWGWLWQHTCTVPYAPITSVGFSSGPLMRLLGSADLTLTLSAAPHAVTLYGIPDAEEFRRFLLDRRDSLREAGLEGDLPPGQLTNEVVLERMTRVLDRLEKRLPPQA